MLSGRVCVVFGVANHRSLAWSVAQSWRNAGGTVALLVQSERFVEQVRKLCPPASLPPIICDVTKEDDVAKAFSVISERHGGKCDAILHSVAYASQHAMRAPLLETTEEDYLQSHHISAYSLIRIARHAVPLMKDGGSLLTLSYVGSQRVFPNYKVMGSAKASLETLSKYLAVELGPKNIRVNTLSPGPVDTLAARGIPGFTEMKEHALSHAPLKVDSDSVKRCVGDFAVFLASDAGKQITGQNFVIDGGYSTLG